MHFALGHNDDEDEISVRTYAEVLDQLDFFGRLYFPREMVIDIDRFDQQQERFVRVIVGFFTLSEDMVVKNSTTDRTANSVATA